MTRATATAGRLSGFSGPRISPTKPNSQAMVGKTLKKVKPGDLLALTLTAGDGSGHLASGEDRNQVTWMVATKLSTFVNNCFKRLLILTVIECLTLIAKELRIGHAKNVGCNPTL